MKKHLKYLEISVLSLLSSMCMMKGAIAWQQQQPQSQNNYNQNNDDDDFGYNSQSGQLGGGYPQQPGGVGQQPGGYPSPAVPTAPAGDNGASALFGAIANLGTTALTTNAQTQQLGMSTQATTMQAQNLEQTQFGLQGNAIRGGLQQQAMNNQAGIMGSAGVMGAAGGYPVGIHPGTSNYSDEEGHLRGHYANEGDYPVESTHEGGNPAIRHHLDEYREQKEAYKARKKEEVERQLALRQAATHHTPATHNVGEHHEGTPRHEDEHHPSVTRNVGEHHEGTSHHEDEHHPSTAHNVGEHHEGIPPHHEKDGHHPSVTHKREQHHEPHHSPEHQAHAAPVHTSGSQKSLSQEKIEKAREQEKTKSLKEHHQEPPVKHPHPDQKHKEAAPVA